VNLADAYTNAIFDHTTQLLTIPIRNGQREVTVACQCLNKRDGKPYSHQDITFASIFASFCGLILENGKMYNENRRSSLQLLSFVKATLSISTNQAVKAILCDVMENARTVVSAERASLFTLDERIGVLSSYLVDGDCLPPTIPMSHGIAAATAKTRNCFIVNDADRDSDFNKMIDLHTKFKTSSVLTAPVISFEGVAEMVNKQEGIVTANDFTMLQSFAALTTV
jgi:GAF domain-containing protein